MVSFIHLTSESRISNIRRNGISRLSKTHPPVGKGIFAMPVTANFYVSHQWLRELRRGNNGKICAVYFRIADEEIVYLGHYGKHHQAMTAAQAVAFVMNQQAEGFEVIIPRKITAKEIRRIKHVPQITGWRYSPSSHGKKPCGCSFCQRGNYGAKKVRAAYEAEYEKVPKK